MRKALLMIAVTAAATCNLKPVVAETKVAETELEAIEQQLEALKIEHEKRIQVLEGSSLNSNGNSKGQSSFNPAISLILDGRYASFDNDPEEYELPGFALGGEAGLGEKGFSVGHTELMMSANVDDKFFGRMTVAIAEHEGSTEVELEEAFIQTLGLGHGLTIKAGRFLSEIGYLNTQHAHSWDFADAPLIYRGLFGNQLIDDGVQLTYVVPVDLFLQVGAEASSGSRFPAGGTSDGVGAWTVFADVGGDLGIEHSWQLGLSHWQADDVEGRASGGHAHGGGDVETPSFDGDSKINALDLVYKWAPNGNPKNTNFKLQFEYFSRQENGGITMLNSGPPLETSSYDGDQNGWYLQATYRFKPQWQTGLRYDRLSSNNTGSDSDVLAEAGLDDEGHTPERISVMVEWVPSEFSRIRLQYNRDDSYEETDNQLFLQYTMSLGSHGAHSF
ncbi:MAG: porin [Pseudomonadales bacterium]|nr:porin [Pseudomonadales bacterium]